MGRTLFLPSTLVRPFLCVILTVDCSSFVLVFRLLFVIVYVRHSKSLVAYHPPPPYPLNGGLYVHSTRGKSPHDYICFDPRTGLFPITGYNGKMLWLIKNRMSAKSGLCCTLGEAIGCFVPWSRSRNVTHISRSFVHSTDGTSWKETEPRVQTKAASPPRHTSHAPSTKQYTSHMS